MPVRGGRHDRDCKGVSVSSARAGDGRVRTQVVLDVAGAVAALGERCGVGGERWPIPGCDPQGGGPPCVPPCIGGHAVVEHVALGAQLEDVALEEDELEQHDDAEGDVDEDGRRPAIGRDGVSLAALAALVLIWRRGLVGGHGVLEVLDCVPPRTCCAGDKAEENEEAHEAPEVDAAQRPCADFLQPRLAVGIGSSSRVRTRGRVGGRESAVVIAIRRVSRRESRLVQADLRHLGLALCRWDIANLSNFLRDGFSFGSWGFYRERAGKKREKAG